MEGDSKDLNMHNMLNWNVRGLDWPNKQDYVSLFLIKKIR